MNQLILQRIFHALPTLFVLSFVAFILIRLVPGDPVLLMLGERGVSPEAYHELQANLGLDRPWVEQYGRFLWRAAHGDLGESIVSKRPVLEEFVDRFPATVELSAMAMIIAVVIGVPLGVLAAVRYGGFLDALLMGTALIGYSMPIFWWALLLILVFSVHLGLVPVAGRIAAIYDVPTKTGFLLLDSWFTDQKWATFLDALHHMILPSVVLATIPLAALARMTRSSLLEVLGEEYIRTARAKGVVEVRVIFIHALKNALIPVVTVLGLMVGSLLTGAVLTETIFSWPGIGNWLVKSVTSRDYPVIQGALLLVAIVVMSVNLIVDILYLFLNPRLRNSHG